MSVSLSKGGNLSLSKTNPRLTKLLIGLGWDARATYGADFDLDGSAFLLTSKGKVRADTDFIFYNNLTAIDESVEHTGDNLTGDGDGDDESIIIHLDKISPRIEKIAITVTIHEAEIRKQNFGQVSNAYIRCVDNSTGKEIARFDLTEDSSTETAMIFGEIYRHNSEWKFRAVGQGFAGGLAALARNYGVNI